MKLTSRERILQAIECRPTDHVPLCFLLFSALRARSSGETEHVGRQLELGVDAVVSLPGLPTPYHEDVAARAWLEPATPYPLLHKVYRTPAGELECIVEKTPDWPHGNDIPLFSDFIIPRAKKFLVEKVQDLERLKFVLGEPDGAAIGRFRQQAKALKAFAEERGLAVGAGPGITRIGDAVCWLCGATQFAVMGLTEPDLLAGVVRALADWYRRRLEIVLDTRPDVVVQAEWYASTFLSPTLYKRFLAPVYREQADMIHAAGARACYLGTTNMMPFLDTIKTLGVEAIFGVDPIQGRWDMAEAKRNCQGQVCLWGGINGYLHIVDGSEGEVEKAVVTAMEVLAPGGGFILGPVDDVRIEPADPAPEQTWERICRNVRRMVDAWKRLR